MSTADARAPLGDVLELARQLHAQLKGWLVRRRAATRRPYRPSWGRWERGAICGEPSWWRWTACLARAMREREGVDPTVYAAVTGHVSAELRRWIARMATLVAAAEEWTSSVPLASQTDFMVAVQVLSSITHESDHSSAAEIVSWLSGESEHPPGSHVAAPGKAITPPMLMECTESILAMLWVVGWTLGQIEERPATPGYDRVDRAIAAAALRWRVEREATTEGTVELEEPVELGAPSRDPARPTSGDARRQLERWNDLALRFVDGHTVDVSISRKAVRQLTCDDLGLANSRGEPDRGWRALEALAEGRGVLELSDATKESVSVLRNALRAHFGLDGEPLPSRGAGAGWRAAFNVYPQPPDDRPE